MIRKEQVLSSGVEFEQYADCVFDWATKKGIVLENGATIEGQIRKLLEEAGEVSDAVLGEEGLEASKLEIGDVLVVLLILCRMLEVDMVDCLRMAYNKINLRNGEIKNGVFVKEEA